jgi:putative ATPase
VVYLATAPKSNSAYEGLKSARRAIKEGPVQQVPLHLRDASTKTNKSFGHGADYRYSHNYPEGISGQDFMETPQKFYHPRNSGAEKAIAERLQRWRSIRKTEGN